MTSFADMIRAISGRYNDKILKSSSELFRCLNLNYFWHTKVSNKGGMACLGSNLAWCEHFSSEKMYVKYPFLRHSNGVQSGVRLLKDTDHAPMSKILQSGRENYNMQLQFSIIEKTQEGIEEFGFTSGASDDVQISLLFNSVSLLRLFGKRFKEENHSIISRLEDNQVDFIDLLGTRFYETAPVLVQNPEENEALFQKLIYSGGIPLTSGEMEVVKLVLKGYSAAQIGERLFRSRRTIEHCLERVKMKLSCESKAELIQKMQNMALWAV